MVTLGEIIRFPISSPQQYNSYTTWVFDSLLSVFNNYVGGVLTTMLLFERVL